MAHLAQHWIKNNEKLTHSPNNWRDDPVLIIHTNAVTERLCNVFIADDVMQCQCALLLTMIFSTGELVPFTLYGKSSLSSVLFSAHNYYLTG